MHRRMCCALAALARAGPPEPDRGRSLWESAPLPRAGRLGVCSRLEASRRVLREAVQLLQEGRGGARLLQEEEEVLGHNALALGLLAFRARRLSAVRLPCWRSRPPCAGARQLYDRSLLRNVATAVSVRGVLPHV